MSHWQPSAEIEILQKRAQLFSEVRAFFAAKGVLEVDVPVLAHAAVTDPNIESFIVTSSLKPIANYYLMTSPEFYMKRLLAAGCGAIYYLGHAFRDEQTGSRHQIEFAMLEWYRPHWTMEQLMQEVAALVDNFLPGDVQRITYRQAFMDYVGVDPHCADLVALKQLAHKKLSPAFDSEDRTIWLDLLFSHLVEPQLSGKVFLEQFPAAQAALAQTHTDAYGNQVASRFELYIDGVEIANGYQEELDAGVLAQRFSSDQALRRCREQYVPSADDKFLTAMQAGIPPCAGVALGVDRLLMAMTDQKKIAAVLPFAF
jgi:lysyl-tRNA synthetase class 2